MRLRSDQDFVNYKLVHDFYYETPLKKWIDNMNYINLFVDDWNEMMPVIEKIMHLDIDDEEGDELRAAIWNEVTSFSDKAAFIEIAGFLKWYNKQ